MQLVYELISSMTSLGVIVVALDKDEYIDLEAIECDGVVESSKGYSTFNGVIV